MSTDCSDDILFRAFAALSYFQTFVCELLFVKNCRVRFAQFVLCTLVVVQFSMTDLSRLASGPPSARLDYYTTLQTLCQELF